MSYVMSYVTSSDNSDAPFRVEVLAQYNDWYLMLHKVDVEGQGNDRRVTKCDCKVWVHDGGKCPHELVISQCVFKTININGKCAELPRRTKQGRKRKTLLALFTHASNSPVKGNNGRGKGMATRGKAKKNAPAAKRARRS